MTTTHEFDAYCDTLPLEDPPYHEQWMLAQAYKAALESSEYPPSSWDAIEFGGVSLSDLTIRTKGGAA